MTKVPEAFYEKLKEVFANSEEYKGYDADEDPGYFQEFLVRLVYELTKAKSAVE
jgi:hypothetical protein